MPMPSQLHVRAAQAALSGSPGDWRAAMELLACVMGEAPAPVLPAVLHALGPLLDRADHDALGPSDFRIYVTPPGVVAPVAASSLSGQQHAWCLCSCHQMWSLLCTAAIQSAEPALVTHWQACAALAANNREQGRSSWACTGPALHDN